MAERVPGRFGFSYSLDFRTDSPALIIHSSIPGWGGWLPLDCVGTRIVVISSRLYLDYMKEVFAILGAVGLLAGCAASGPRLTATVNGTPVVVGSGVDRLVRGDPDATLRT